MQQSALNWTPTTNHFCQKTSHATFAPSVCQPLLLWKLYFVAARYPCILRFAINIPACVAPTHRLPKNMSISRHWSTDASWALWLTHCFKSLGREWKAHLDYKTRRADANEKEGGNMGNAVSFTPSNWSAPIQRDYKQLKQAVTLQTIRYLIKPQHERAFGRGKGFLMCTHSLKKQIYLVSHWAKEGEKSGNHSPDSFLSSKGDRQPNSITATDHRPIHPWVIP